MRATRRALPRGSRPAAVPLAAAVLLAIALLPVVPAAAEPVRTVERTDGPFGVAGGVRFTPPDVTDPLAALIEVSGLGPRRFLGTVELLPRRSGIDVVNELGFDTYLYGLAEVPRAWPEAVLEAQVVAARTYAWSAIERATYSDYDICATTACQVFRGAEVLLARGGPRWRAAVDATSGLVLLHEGAPILARYFSTSGGRTYPNEHVFPSSGPRPYLVGIDDPFDALSPLHRWESRFTRAEFDAILSQGTTLSRAVPLARVERLGAVDDPRAELRLTGTHGRSVTITAIALRDFLSSRAPALDAGRFPPLRADGAARLPATVPTTRYAVTVTADEVVVAGLGWGHGVGMGQWGAHARALAGHSAEDILAAYYGGLRPVAAPGVPTTIRAGMGAARLDVEESVAPDGTAGAATTTIGMRVTLTVPSTVTDRAGRVLDRGLGTWRVDRVRTAAGAATGDRLVLTPPEGHGEPLEVAPTVTWPGLAWGPGATLGSVHPGALGAIDAITHVSKPVLLRLEARQHDTDTVTWSRELGLAERGVHWIRWFPDDAPGIDPRTHRFVLVGTDVTGARAGG
jgi:SpoIID/LytB domain protein